MSNYDITKIVYNWIQNSVIVFNLLLMLLPEIVWEVEEGEEYSLLLSPGLPGYTGVVVWWYT